MLKNYESLTSEKKRAAIFIDIYYKGKRIFITPYIKNKDAQGIKELSSFIGIKASELFSWKCFPVYDRNRAALLKSDYVFEEINKYGLNRFITTISENNGDNPILLYRIAEILGMSLKEIYDISKGPERSSQIYNFDETKETIEKSVTFEDQMFIVRGLIDVYEFVCLLPSIEDVISFIKENSYINNIFVGMFNEKKYSKSLSSIFGEEKAKEMVEKIKLIYSEYKEILREKRQKLSEEKEASTSSISQREKALSIIKEYILSDAINSRSYISNGNTTENIFRRALITVKEYYPDIYKEYLDREKENETEIKEQFNKQILSVLSLLKNGVETESGLIRQFDIIDYFTITRVPPRNIHRYFRLYVSGEDFNNLGSFITQNKNPSVIDLKKLKPIRYVINKDGVEKELTDKDKEIVIEYLKSEGIPLLSSTFSAAIKRYNSGFLSLEGFGDQNRTYS